MTLRSSAPDRPVAFSLFSRRVRVIVVEKSHFDRPRFGETAPPELRQALTRVGLEHLARSPLCREAPEVLSVWGSDDPRSRHHIFSPYGTELHLDRRAFDEALALAAHDAGADLRLGCTARFAAQPRDGYMVQLSTGERIRANVAILATGRAGVVSAFRICVNTSTIMSRLLRVFLHLWSISIRGRSSKPFQEDGSIWLPCRATRSLRSSRDISAARSQRASCAFALVVGSLGTNHRRPLCVEWVSAPGNSVGGKRARFFCSIGCRRPLACDRRRAYRARPAVRARDHLGDRRRCFSDGPFGTHGVERSCPGHAGENRARSRGLSLRALARLFK